MKVYFSIGPVVEDATWFPDGNHLIFSANGTIYDSKDMQPLSLAVAGELSEPAVSPDGKSLALTATQRHSPHLARRYYYERFSRTDRRFLQ